MKSEVQTPNIPQGDPTEGGRARPGKPRRVARVSELCTGCGGTPICVVFCPQGALELTDDAENVPFKMMEVNPSQCTGCGSCIARGPKGSRILGCPWDAIRLVPE